jgi:putative intracellular protease/amidase
MRKLITAMTLLFALSAAAETKTRNVAIFLYEGVEVLDWTGPAEVLQASSHFVSHENPPLNMFTVARTKEPVISQQFIKVVPDYAIADAPRIDVLVIPGGNTGPTTADAAAMEWIRKTVDNAEVVLTVCTGAMPLARLGYFDGLEVTTWYGAIQRLQQVAPKAIVKDGRRFVDNGRIITTAGVSAGIDGALHLVARIFGRRIADQTAQYMEYHWTPEPYLARSYAYLNPSTDERGRALQSGEMYAQSNDSAAAIATYQRLVDSNPDDLEAWYRLGRMKHLARDFEPALAAYEKASANEMFKALALYNTACVYGLMKDRDHAVASLERAIAAGFQGRNFLDDPDLAILKEDARVVALAAK